MLRFVSMMLLILSPAVGEEGSDWVAKDTQLDPRHKCLVPPNTPTGWLQGVLGSYTIILVRKEVMVKMDPRHGDLVLPLVPTTTEWLWGTAGSSLQ